MKCRRIDQAKKGIQLRSIVELLHPGDLHVPKHHDLAVRAGKRVLPGMVSQKI